MADTINTAAPTIEQIHARYVGAVAWAHGLLDSLKVHPGIEGERNSIARLKERMSDHLERAMRKIAVERDEATTEVAALRARVAELEAGAYALGRVETLRRCGSEITADADVPLSDLDVNHALDVQLARQWLAEADRLEAERAPKARDESVPPPGWILWWKDGDEQTPENIERADRAMRDGPLVTAIPIAQAWRFYDREHGYAPDEARIRADERAKLSKALHRMAVEETESDARSAGLHEAAMFVESDAALATAAPPRRIPVPTTATALADEMADAVRTVRAHVDGLLLQQYHRLLDSGVPPSRMVRQSVPSMRRERIVDAARPGGQWVETRTSPHEGIGQVCLEVALVDWEPGT